MNSRAATRVSSALIALLGIAVFASALADAPRYKSWDYGPHQLVTRSLVRGIAVGHVPQWLLSGSTGDAPLDTYPWLTYAAAALLSLALGGETEAPRALLILAIGCHVTLALLIARLSSRFAPIWIATALGAFALLDAGRFESGAAMTVLEVGLIHAALAQCFGLLGLLAVVDIVQRGFSRARIATATAGIATACATHPSGLLFAAAVMAALVSGAAFERTPPRRCLYALLAVTAGFLAAAVVWAPFAERTLLYGAHFGYPPHPFWQALTRLLSGQQPPTCYPWLFTLGWLGVVLAAIRRPRGGWFLATLVILLALPFTEVVPWLGFDLAPQLFARLQAFRFLTLLRPLLLISAGIPLSFLWRLSPRGASLAKPAVALGLAVAMLSALTPASLAALRALPRAGVPDPAGFQELVDWAREAVAQVPPGKLGRLMFSGDETGIYHVTAEAGMPAFYVGDGVAMLLRERISDASPESLRRFDVRYVVRRDRDPVIGDPGSARHFGRYSLREFPAWDGSLARIETGNGVVRVTRSEDERIDVSLEATDQPALVAFGMGYYPRWRAFAASGEALPTFALPATPGSTVRVLAAWLPPGRTTLRPDGALPSDGAGRARGVCGLALLGALLAPGSKRRARRRTRAPLLSRGLSRNGARALLVLGLAGGLALLAGPRWPAPRALRLFDGLRSEARVEARPDGGAWTNCRGSALLQRFECPGLGSVVDTTAFSLSDHPSSTPFVTPGILATADQGRQVDFRVVWTRAPLGPWVGAAWGVGSAWLGANGEPQRIGVAATRGTSGPDADELLLRVKRNSRLGATIVRPDAVDVDRATDVPWAPATPPGEVARLAARLSSPRP